MSAPATDNPEPVDRAGWRDVVRLLDGQRTALAAAALLGVAAAGCGLAQPLLVRRTVDAATGGSLPVGPVVVLVALFLAQAFTLALTRYLEARVSETVALRLRRALIDHLLRLRIPVYQRHRTGDLIARATGDPTVIRTLVARSITNAASGTIGLVGLVLVMAWLDWVLFLVVAALIGVAALVLLVVVRHIRAESDAAQQASGALVADLERALSAIRTVRASRAESAESTRIYRQAREAYRANVRMARLDAAAGSVNDLALTGSYLVILLVGGVRVTSGASTLGELVAFMLYLTYLTTPVGSMFQAVSAVRQGAGALHRVNEALALPRESPGAVAPTARYVNPRRSAGAAPAQTPAAEAPLLELRDVWFGYDQRRPVLRGLSLRVPERGHIALIGSSGAGKSTLFSIIERFYEPDDGRLLFRGRDAHDVPHDEYRTAIGLVEQHCPLLFGTLRQNLTYASGPSGGPVDDEDLRRVLALTSLTELVDRLPEGLDTDVGEHGQLLSGGERQRIAIARGLLPRPALLLLDEPTAHLDPANEATLIRTLREVSRVCALLVIAHRASTIRHADRVLLLKDGIIAAESDHRQRPAERAERVTGTGW